MSTEGQPIQEKAPTILELVQLSHEARDGLHTMLKSVGIEPTALTDIQGYSLSRQLTQSLYALNVLQTNDSIDLGEQEQLNSVIQRTNKLVSSFTGGETVMDFVNLASQEEGFTQLLNAGIEAEDFIVEQNKGLLTAVVRDLQKKYKANYHHLYSYAYQGAVMAIRNFIIYEDIDRETVKGYALSELNLNPYFYKYSYNYVQSGLKVDRYFDIQQQVYTRLQRYEAAIEEYEEMYEKELDIDDSMAVLKFGRLLREQGVTTAGDEMLLKATRNAIKKYTNVSGLLNRLSIEEIVENEEDGREEMTYDFDDLYNNPLREEQELKEAIEQTWFSKEEIAILWMRFYEDKSLRLIGSQVADYRPEGDQISKEAVNQKLGKIYSKIRKALEGETEEDYGVTVGGSVFALSDLEGVLDYFDSIEDISDVAKVYAASSEFEASLVDRSKEIALKERKKIRNILQRLIQAHQQF